eukprot:gene15500-17079_t
MRFQVFKVQNWQTVSPRYANTDDCLDELRYSYSKLSDEQNAAISTPRANQQHKLYCICRQRYKPSDPTMVQCNICNDWYHHACIKMDATFLSQLAPRYHCDSCISKIFQALLNYMRHQEEQPKDAERITELDDVIASMDEESKNILQNHEFLPAPIDRSAIVSDNLNHIRGIQNPISTCWLNAIVHLVCGTGIIGLLLSYSCSAETEISRELIMIRIRLVGKAKSAVSLRQVQNLPLFVNPALFDPRIDVQRDPLEFYAAIIEYYMANIPCERIVNDHKMAIVDLCHCLNCNGKTGAESK